MNAAEIASRRQLAWNAWIASHMKAINRQFVAFGMGEIKFESLNAKGQAQIEQEFNEWWSAKDVSSSRATCLVHPH